MALGLTLTWGVYAYLKKSLPIGPNEGFFLEVLMLFVPALGYVVWLQAQRRQPFPCRDVGRYMCCCWAAGWSRRCR